MSADIYLASRSPRRHQLLRQLGVAFEEIRLREALGRRPDVVEQPHENEHALDYVQRIAMAKASVAVRRVAARGRPEKPVLAADTEVVLDDVVFGKPSDAKGAIRMLSLLAGRTHQVLTAIALCWNEEQLIALSASTVTFRAIGQDEIGRYVAGGESLDKAGAYAVQGKAAAFISRIDGSYSGIMGLPLFETAEALAKIGMRVL